MAENHEEDYDDEREDQGNIAVKFFILLCFGVIIILALGMFIQFILEYLGFSYPFPFNMTPSVIFVIGVVFGYIIRDLVLRGSKK